MFELKNAADILFDPHEAGFLPYEPVILDMDDDHEVLREADVAPVVDVPEVDPAEIVHVDEPEAEVPQARDDVGAVGNVAEVGMIDGEVADDGDASSITL